MGTIFLTSNGIKGNKINSEIREYITSDIKKAGIITTASESEKGNDKHVPFLISTIEAFGLTVDLIDIEFESANKIMAYDLIYIMGGNPFYLLNFLKKGNFKEAFEALLLKGKIIIGSSAGSVVLGPSIELVYEFEPGMNEKIGLRDFTGLGLTKIEICPHKAEFARDYTDFYKRLAEYERIKCNEIELIENEEAIIINTETNYYRKI